MANYPFRTEDYIRDRARERNALYRERHKGEPKKPMTEEQKLRRRAYDKARNKDRAADKRIVGKAAPFVAIDSEGINFGPSFRSDEKHDWQDHRTVLWAASDSAKTAFLTANTCDYGGELEGLRGPDILDWLLRLPDHFGKHAIYIAFSFGYDVTEILRDLPFEKAWEVSRQKPFGKPDAKSSLNMSVLWGDYAIRYQKGKQFTVSRLRDRDEPFKERLVNGAIQRSLDVVKTVRIFDVFGFFQCSFLHAARSIPGVFRDDDEDIISGGKVDRLDFRATPVLQIKRYTKAELHVLVRMMDTLRDGLAARGLNLTRWHGAGSIAQAMLKQEGALAHYGPVATRDLPGWQTAAHYAFFGGRIELMKVGVHEGLLHGYDLASAYPAMCLSLPSMAGGKWEHYEGPSSLSINELNVLSIIRVRWRGDLFGTEPFYPLPYRKEDGSVIFPASGHGWYMADEVRAAIEWNEARGEPLSFSTEEIYEFIPGGTVEPFGFVQRIFDERAELVAKHKKGGPYDITEKVLKLGMNSIYGKTAQRVGTMGEAPKCANPWYAAAITAGTRAALLRAATHDPDAIVMFATDGIISTRPLPLTIPKTKTLGTWEYGTSDGGIFVLSGIYALGDQAKTRGIKPAFLRAGAKQWLVENVIPKWRTGGKEAAFPYKNFLTLGAACASEERYRLAGHWCDGARKIDLTSAGSKRSGVHLGYRPDRHLVPTTPRIYPLLESDMSAMSRPDWLDLEEGQEAEMDMETEIIMTARFDGEGE